MQGIDGEWEVIDGDPCETVPAEEDEGVPFSSGHITVDGNQTPYGFRINEPAAAFSRPATMGWECPKCHACHAPHVDSCPNCLPQYAQPVISPTPYVYPTTYPNGLYPNGDTPHVFTIGGNSCGVDSVTSAELRVSSDLRE